MSRKILIFESDLITDTKYKEVIGKKKVKKGQVIIAKLNLYDTMIYEYRTMKVRLRVKNIFGQFAYLERF